MVRQRKEGQCGKRWQTGYTDVMVQGRKMLQGEVGLRRTGKGLPCGVYRISLGCRQAVQAGLRPKILEVKRLDPNNICLAIPKHDQYVGP
eukprot:328685-Pelagomonas_calceolata.AAC.1